MESDIGNQVRRILSEVSGMEDVPITDDMTLIDDLSMDSLDLVDLGLRIESSFGLYVPDDFLPDEATVGDVVKYVEISLDKAGKA